MNGFAENLWKVHIYYMCLDMLLTKNSNRFVGHDFLWLYPYCMSIPIIHYLFILLFIIIILNWFPSMKN